MSNVKPMEDQAWKLKRTGATFEVNTVSGSDVYFIGIFDPVTLDELYSDYEFVPQKETKMIDLIKATIGDEFEFCHAFNMDVGKLVHITKSGERYVFEDEKGLILVTDAKGENKLGNVKLDSIKKRDPRHWLKDLPAADLFMYGWIAYDKKGGWYSFSKEPEVKSVQDNYFSTAGGAHNSVSGIKMPTLTGDEWKLSKISIPELKLWQEANKNTTHRKLEQFKDY